MDEFLAELYGTQQNIGGAEDLEKTAAEELLVKLAAEEGVDLAELSDETISELLDDIEKHASAEEGDEQQVDEEAQEKLAEADFLGRAMAHAYVAELSEIEKEAGVGSKLLGKLERLGGRIAGKSVGKAGEKAYKGQVMKRLQQARGSGMRGKAADRMRAAARKEGVHAGVKAMKRRARMVGGGAVAGGAAALGGGAYAAKKGLEKGSADAEFENAAQQRAYEMLAEAGYDVEKIAEADIQAQVDARAIEMLEEAGYPTEQA